MSKMGKSLSYKMYSLYLLWFFLKNQYLNTTNVYALLIMMGTTMMTVVVKIGSDSYSINS